MLYYVRNFCCNIFRIKVICIDQYLLVIKSAVDQFFYDLYQFYNIFSPLLDFSNLFNEMFPALRDKLPNYDREWVIIRDGWIIYSWPGTPIGVKGMSSIFWSKNIPVNFQCRCFRVVVVKFHTKEITNLDSNPRRIISQFCYHWASIALHRY